MPGSVETTLTPPIGIIDPENQRSSVMVMVVVSPASIVTSVTEGTMLHDAMRSVARRKRQTYLGFIGVDTEPEARSLVGARVVVCWPGTLPPDDHDFFFRVFFTGNAAAAGR